MSESEKFSHFVRTKWRIRLESAILFSQNVRISHFLTFWQNVTKAPDRSNYFFLLLRTWKDLACPYMKIYFCISLYPLFWHLEWLNGSFYVNKNLLSQEFRDCYTSFQKWNKSRSKWGILTTKRECSLLLLLLITQVLCFNHIFYTGQIVPISILRENIAIFYTA